MESEYIKYARSSTSFGTLLVAAAGGITQLTAGPFRLGCRRLGGMTPEELASYKNSIARASVAAAPPVLQHTARATA